MAATLQISKVTRPLEVSENKAFSFVKKESKFTRLTEKRDSHIEKVGEINPSWAIFTPLILLAAVAFMIFEAYAATTTIAGLVDSMGDNSQLNWLWTILGLAIAIFGMYVGDQFFESFEEDEITGRRIFGFSFYKYLIGSIAFISFQFIASKAAGAGEDEFGFMPYFIAGVALMELLLGGLLLGKALIYTFVFFIAIRLWFIHRGMTSTSRATNNSYRDYRALRDAYNFQNPNNTLVLEGNDNIRRAIAYYSGINLNNITEPATPIVPANDVQQTSTGPVQPVNNSVTENLYSQAAQERPANHRSNQQQNTTEEEVERFINDDDNLTF